jgi:Protein of unknown function (DUF3348)
MERTSPPPPGAGLQGSPLVGLLAQLALADRPATPASFVEGMGRWLGWKHAIPLSAVLQAPPGAAVRPPRSPTGAPPLAAEFTRVHDALTRAIADDATTAGDDGRDFVPWRRHYTGLQQAMEAAVTPLRAQLRDAVARLSPEAARLAALDAVLASALAAPEQAQLAQMPALLGKHFTRLRPPHTEPDPRAPWLQTFRQDMQHLLRAELALRLQPARGLLDTLCGTPQGPHE